MTPDDFRAHLSRLQLSQLGAARLLGAAPRTVRYWARDGDIPKAVQLLLQRLTADDEDVMKARTP